MWRCAKESWSFSGSDLVGLLGLLSDEVGAEESGERSSSSVSGVCCVGCRGRTEYSPMSQIRREPVAWDAVSRRWFCWEDRC